MRAIGFQQSGSIDHDEAVIDIELPTLTKRHSPINAANLKQVCRLIESSKVRGKIGLEGFNTAAT